MTTQNADAQFVGSIAEVYERLLVPMLFVPYADDIVARLRPQAPARLLEIAAGTGVVTRAIAAALPTTEIVATDLNPSMLDQARQVPIARQVTWQTADAMALPFPDHSFDAVVCQFGVMFFPDKAKAYAEARRVLRPGGIFLFNVWDRLPENGVSDAVSTAVADLFPQDPPRFLSRTPYAYNDADVLARDVAAGGFTAKPTIDTVAKRSRAPTARAAATAVCQGTPLRAEIERHGTDALTRATDAATEAVAHRFGAGPIDAPMRAVVVAVAA